VSDLIYGKNKTEGIVSIEVEDDKAILFIEENGQLRTEVVPNRFWILSHEKLSKNAVRLDGDLHYKYGMQYKERSEFTKMRNIFKHKDIYSIYNPQEALMVKDGYTYFKGFKDHKSISTLSFDIETNGLTMDNKSMVILIANTYRKGSTLIRKMFCYDEYESQKDLIDAWCDWVREIDPSFIVGHNIAIYDIPYLKHCAKNADTYLKLGRDGSEVQFQVTTSKFRKDGSQTLDYNKARIYGREIIDTMFLSVKYDVARNFPNYRLKDIIKHLNLAIEDRVYYDASQIRYKYHIPEEMEKIKKYAEHDGDEALMLFDKMIPPSFFLAQSVPKTFQGIIESATGSQINSVMVRSYLQEKHSIAKASDVIQYEGAISIGVPGIYKNCLKVDEKSCYPSCILIERLYDKEKDPKANFFTLVEFNTYKRFEYKQKYKETKDEYFANLDAMGKIFINSAYGFLGAAGLNFNSPKIAARITEMGRDFLNTAIKATTSKDYKYWLELSGKDEEGDNEE
jgi:DNA polymerase elongation subunit (family B)